MYLLDTNHCSGIIDGTETLLGKMDELGEVPIATSFITRAELLYMAFNSEQRDDNMQKVSDFLAGLNLYLVDLETIEAYARLKTDLIKQFGPRAKSARRRTTIRHVGFDHNTSGSLPSHCDTLLPSLRPIPTSPACRRHPSCKSNPGCDLLSPLS